MPKNNCEIIYRKAPGLDDVDCNYPGFQPGQTILKKGTVCKKGHMPLPSDILFDRDVAIPVRDGTILYADIYRPVDESVKVPAILNSTTFGKAKDEGKPVPIQAMCMENEELPGVPKSFTSGLNTFEGTDPGFFVQHGYAVINLDIRGCYKSGGKNPYFGSQEAEDDYDVIEWLAAQDWCNGKVTMTGNSWLGIVQWFAAAEQPPHLACIAPWEGWHDMYRDEYMVGGIANYPGFRYKNTFNEGGLMEDVVANCLAHPLFDAYWEDKRAKVENITLPVYATASWTSPVHCQGTLKAWREIPSKEKWLRIHNTPEWRDTYTPKNEEEMLKFFDHYLKGIDNGWEETPRIRVSVLDPGQGNDIVERVEDSFPLARQELKSMYLDTENMCLTFDKPATESTYSYSGWDEKSMATFRYTFDKETEIVGYMNLKLWVESFGYNDLDLFVKVRKYDKDGNEALHYAAVGNKKFAECIYSGPTSRQRVSLRKLDPAKSTVNEPYHTFDEVQKLLPGEIVPVEIGLFPTGLRFHAGETLEVAIAGYSFFNLPSSHGAALQKMGVDNNGMHIIHAGGAYDSKLIVPFIPVED